MIHLSVPQVPGYLYALFDYGLTEGTFKEEDTILITPPKLMIDVAELHEGKKGVEINSALLIVNEQMRLSGVRKAT
ncbi:hypothetical protein [Lysinibacillus xylanilyticus]|uniref:hypothetical protein n=1 Tax=Lysinibacillus xylanilyticus TaxID=582475 RepID=UPI003CFF87CD